MIPIHKHIIPSKSADQSVDCDVRTRANHWFAVGGQLLICLLWRGVQDNHKIKRQGLSVVIDRVIYIPVPGLYRHITQLSIIHLISKSSGDHTVFANIHGAVYKLLNFWISIIQSVYGITHIGYKFSSRLTNSRIITYEELIYVVSDLNMPPD